MLTATKYTMPTIRIQILDRLRGIALLGILIMNIQTYAVFFAPHQLIYQWGTDQPSTFVPVKFFTDLFISGQFYTIYSFLFGIGFYLMYQKNVEKSLKANKLFIRRLLILLVFGLVHTIVFWFGDILHKYALLGFTLLYFNQKNTTILIRWIIFFTIVPVVVLIIKTIFLSPAVPHTIDEELKTLFTEVNRVWQHGTFWEVVGIQKLGTAMGWARSLIDGGGVSFAQILIMFLLGLIAGKQNWFQRVDELKQRSIKLAWIVFPFGLILKGISCSGIWEANWPLSFLPKYQNLLWTLSGHFGQLALTLVYLVFFTTLFHKRKSIFWDWIANTGRLGLTNYLAQTLICMLLFYGYAFAISGKLNLWQMEIVALAIYAFQVAYSNIWLHWHEMGPMEKLWRKLTYG